MSVDVSVIVPVYDDMPYVTRCIESVLAQTVGREKIEVIAVDDGSTDGTGDELERLAQGHPCMRVVHEPNTRGRSHCRNRGLELAQGRYVFFLDADGCLGTEALGRMVRLADEQGSDVVLGRYSAVAGASVPQSMFDRDQPRTDVFTSRVYWSLSAIKLFRRELIERQELRFPLDMRVGVDQPFVANAYLEASAISVLATYDCVYVGLGGSRSRVVTDLLGKTEVARRPMKVIGEKVEPGPKRDLLMLRHFEIELMRSLPAFLAEQVIDTRRRSFDAMRELVTSWYNDQIAARLPPKGRVAFELIRRDNYDDFCRFLEQTASQKSWEPFVDDDRVFAKYPYFREPRIAIPDTCYEVTSKVTCQRYLDAIAWRGTVLHLAGWAYLDVLSSEKATLSLVLRERTSATEYVQPVKPGPHTKLTSKVWGRRVDHRSAGFSVDVHPADIARTVPQVRGEWDAFLRIRSEGLSRECRIGRLRSQKILVDNERRRFEDGSTAGKCARIRFTKKHDNLTLVIDDQVQLAKPAEPVVARPHVGKPKAQKLSRIARQPAVGSRHQPISIASLNPDIVVVCGDRFNNNHFSVWKPYLSRLPFGVCVCTKTTGGAQVDCGFPVFAEDEGYSIQHIGRIANLKLLLYISNWPNNWRYFYQYPRAANVNNLVRHVFLGHGDSDKESSHSRVAKIYDYIVVADEAAIERYHGHGVAIPKESFLMVGAPTLPGISVRTTRGPLRNLLYAPTFEAKRADANFSSLERLRPLILAQVKANQLGFVFRPHPATGVRLPEYRTYANAISEALPKASRDKVVQFNESDAVISDVSGVMSEYLFTGKPIIVPVAPGDALARKALGESGITDVVYLWNYEAMDLQAFLSSIATDPLLDSRSEFRRKKFLGANSFDESCARFSEALTSVMRPSTSSGSRDSSSTQPDAVLDEP